MTQDPLDPAARPRTGGTTNRTTGRPADRTTTRTAETLRSFPSPPSAPDGCRTGRCPTAAESWTDPAPTGVDGSPLEGEILRLDRPGHDRH